MSEDRAIAVLQRWIASGGHWAVLAESADEVTVGLYTCDGGEEMDRVTLPTAALPKKGQFPRLPHPLP